MNWLGLLLPVVWLQTAPGALAQTPSPVFQLGAEGAEVRGTTVGDYSLTQLASRDRRRKLCLGYGSQAPSHVLELAADRGRLQIRVESDGGDTTLLIQGPEGIDCNDNYTRSHRDAAITRGSWPAGLYRIWVGGFEQGDRFNYRLQVISSESEVSAEP